MPRAFCLMKEAFLILLKPATRFDFLFDESDSVERPALLTDDERAYVTAKERGTYVLPFWAHKPTRKTSLDQPDTHPVC